MRSETLKKILQKIERNERKLETFCYRGDHLENLSSGYNNNNSNEKLQAVTTEQPSDLESSREQQVNSF